jgi:hypothetical protein
VYFCLNPREVGLFTCETSNRYINNNNNKISNEEASRHVSTHE